MFHRRLNHRKLSSCIIDLRRGRIDRITSLISRAETRNVRQVIRSMYLVTTNLDQADEFPFYSLEILKGSTVLYTTSSADVKHMSTSLPSFILPVASLAKQEYRP